MPTLHISLTDGVETTHDLIEETITIGRVPENTIQINDASVSSHHAQLKLTGTDYLLKDLGSTNGTRVNGQTFEEWKLQDGDKIRFGKIDATFASQLAEEAQPMPEAQEAAITPAQKSHRPSDFSNVSPFQAVQKKRDPAGKAIMTFAILAILTFGAAVFSILTLEAP